MTEASVLALCGLGIALLAILGLLYWTLVVKADIIEELPPYGGDPNEWLDVQEENDPWI